MVGEKSKAVDSCHVLLTSHLVHQNTWGNDASVLREELLQFFLSHGFWQATDVQICISDGGGAWTRIGNLQTETADITKAYSNHITYTNPFRSPFVTFVHTNKGKADAGNSAFNPNSITSDALRKKLEKKSGNIIAY